MIRLGYTNEQKIQEIEEYRKKNPEVTTIVVFSPKMFTLPGEYEQYEYADIIMYRVFYPLLERIDNSFLIVVNECLRTKNRSDLTYNCLHHYLNQTKHHMIFEYYPYIESPDEFMILADKEAPGRYKGQGYDPVFLKDLDVAGIRREPVLKFEGVITDEKTKEAYEKEKNRLFDTLGNKDPNTIPRALHLWCGKHKPVSPDMKYLARNKRLNKKNVITYADATSAEHRISLDIPYRRINLNDFLKRVGENVLTFEHTDLSVDMYYKNELEKWNEEIVRFYAEAGIQ